MSITNLVSQSKVVVTNLMKDRGMSREQAVSCWYCSKTKEFLEKNNLYYVSGMRCYYELMLELSNNMEKWLREPFDM